MKPRLIAAAASTAALAAMLSGAVAAPASAAGSCILTAPAKVNIWKPVIPFTLTASGACTSAGGAGGWSLVHPSYGTQEFVRFEGGSSKAWNVYDWDRRGLQTWQPAGAYDPNRVALSQNTPRTDIRLYGGGWISASRSGSVVTLTGTAINYNSTTQTFTPRYGAGGQFQYRDRGTSTWKPLIGVTTGTGGTATFRLTNPVARDYRFAVYSTSTIWDGVSSSVTK